MDTINEFIHEIVAVLIFCSAMGLLILLTNISYTGNDNAAQATEQKVNVKESIAGFSGDITVDGTTAVADIIANAELYPKASYKIVNDKEVSFKNKEGQIEKHTNTTISTNTITMIAKKERKNGKDYTEQVRTDILPFLTGTVTDAGKTYYPQYSKSFSYNEKGEVVGITYTQVAPAA